MYIDINPVSEAVFLLCSFSMQDLSKFLRFQFHLLGYFFGDWSLLKKTKSLPIPLNVVFVPFPLSVLDFQEPSTTD